MSKSVLFIIILLVIVFTVIISQYIHKRHLEYKMVDIEKAVRNAFPEGVETIGKNKVVDAVKKHFHCSSKDALYMLGVARRKRLIDMQGENITLLE